MTVHRGFDDIAARYERDSVAQRSAAEILLDLLDLRAGERVLDVGCGTGHLTDRIAATCGADALGVDPSEGMIAEARRRFPARRFERVAAEDLAADGTFDVVFSNSALMWFRDPPRALARCRAALRPGGRVGAQMPATQRYCPQFVEAIAAVAADPEAGPTFARWRSPWFFLETAEAYAALFEAAGLRVRLARLQALTSRHDLDGAMKVFESGAAAGYLGQDWYGAPVTPAYAARVRGLVREALAARAGSDGAVELEFRRAFVVAARD